jgi:ethanolamine ammonia-lyase small subunit
MYLQRPDKGRRLNEPSREVLLKLDRPASGYDVVLVIGDGLSSFAIEENAAAFLDILLPLLIEQNWSVAPLVIVQQARVAIGDEVGGLLGARLVVMLIGERPGLSSPDSMGIYMTLNPRVGLTDESRNCISNVRREGLSYELAAHKLLYLMSEALKRGLSGVQLKDEAEEPSNAVSGPRRSFLTQSN